MTPQDILKTLAVFLVLVGPTCSGRAENWPGFRGPSGLGYSKDGDLPLSWGGTENKNVVWQSPLNGQGHASPIVWEDRVLVCTALWPPTVRQRDKAIPEQHVSCYRVADGKLLWDTLVPPGPWLRTDFRSWPGVGEAAATPATGGT